MSQTLQDLDRRPLHARVAESIENLISSNDMRPGDQLPSEAQLCEMTGVSRVVVRSALSQLAGRGIIKISSGKRARVGILDPNVFATLVQHGVATDQISVQKVLEVRQGVEVAASRLAALRITDEQVANLSKICDEMEAAIDDVEEFVELDYAFHLAIAEATANELYTYIIQPLRRTIKDSIETGRLQQNSQDDLRQIQTRHRQIEQAIIQRDPDAAETAMKRHFEVAARAIEEGS